MVENCLYFISKIMDLIPIKTYIFSNKLDQDKQCHDTFLMSSVNFRRSYFPDGIILQWNGFQKIFNKFQIIYTSRSISDIVTHFNILLNIRSVFRSIDVDSQSIKFIISTLSNQSNHFKNDLFL